MKLRSKIVFLLFGWCVTNGLYAQIAEGNWYTPLDNKLLQLVISKDSILFRKCSFDVEMKEYGDADLALKIEKLNNGNFIVSQTKEATQTFYLFFPAFKGDQLQGNIESLNSKFPTPAEAENALQSTEKPPMDIVFLNRATIDKIRQQKPIETMTAADFKNYAQRIIYLDASTAVAFRNKKCKLNYVYMESTGKILLSELGFNSLVKGDAFDTMWKRFTKDPETQEIFTKMTRRK